MEGVLSFNTTTPHSITCLLQFISTLDFVLIRTPLAIWDLLLSPLGKADLAPLWVAPVLSPCTGGHSCGNSTCSPLLFLDILSLLRTHICTFTHWHTHACTRTSNVTFMPQSSAKSLNRLSPFSANHPTRWMLQLSQSQRGCDLGWPNSRAWVPHHYCSLCYKVMYFP